MRPIQLNSVNLILIGLKNEPFANLFAGSRMRLSTQMRRHELKLTYTALTFVADKVSG